MQFCVRWMFAILAGGLVVPSVSQANEEEVRAFLRSYIEAFNQEQIEVVSGMWTESAVHVDLGSGISTEGREAIVADIKTAFAADSESRITGELESIRFPTEDVAILSGTLTTTVTDQDPTINRFSVVVVRKEGDWRMDSVEETPLPELGSAAAALRDLDWMVGDWIDETPDRRIVISVGPSENGNFLIRTIADQQADGTVARAGTEIIGWDPRAQQIRSWAFNADGSFGDGIWSRNGEDWLIKSTQTLADGQAASGTYVITPLDDNTLEVRLIGHEVEGAPVPANAPATLVRVGAEPTAEAADSPAETGEAADAAGQ